VTHLIIFFSSTVLWHSIYEGAVSCRLGHYFETDLSIISAIPTFDFLPRLIRIPHVSSRSFYPISCLILRSVPNMDICLGLPRLGIRLGTQSTHFDKPTERVVSATCCEMKLPNARLHSQLLGNI